AASNGRSATVQVLSDSIAADGASRAAVVVQLAGDTPLGTEVTVTTDMGTLAGSGQPAGQQLKYNAGSRTDTLVLVSGLRAGVATVTVQTGKSFASDSVRMTAATPQFIELTTDATRATATGEDAITATAKLYRPLGAGTVTLGTRVRFDVYNAGTPVPSLSGISETNDAGTATHRITSRTAGTYLLVASAAGKADSVTIVFDPPPP
ncbi:MAG TPA: hypothetical protein VF142_17775, partial [Longimicrobium sp.]